MSQMMKQRMVIFALAAAFTLAGCSSEDPRSSFNPDTGHSAANWVPAGHKAAAANDVAACTECHGADLLGGISNISCTNCHLGGPAAVHPADWDPIFSTHGPYVNTAPTGTAACANQYCHGTSLAGVPDSGPSCTSCHDLPFDPASVTCGACHRIPPAGTQTPNRAGSHAIHTAMTGTIQASCDACHIGASAYVGDHSNGAMNVSFLTAYNAKGAAATYNAGGSTCSNISCHGGQTSPNWISGTLDVNTACTSCHVVGGALATPQYNSAYSGEHDKHVNGESIACYTCHDTTALAVDHFTRLDTSTMEGPASATLRTQTGYNGTSCNPSQGGLSGCHSSKAW